MVRIPWTKSIKLKNVLVADTVLFVGAVAGQMADQTAVVALLALGAVAGKMAVATAGVAGLAASAVSVAGSTAGGRALAGDVANLAALVALSSTLSAVSASLLATGLGAVARKMAWLTAAVAGLLLLGTSAFTA